MLKTEIIEFQEVMDDLLNPFSTDEKKPTYYVLNFKDKTIIPISSLSIRALKAFGKDRYSVFAKRYKVEKETSVSSEELAEALNQALEDL